jgi:hypothetical protein
MGSFLKLEKDGDRVLRSFIALRIRSGRHQADFASRICIVCARRIWPFRRDTIFSLQLGATALLDIELLARIYFAARAQPVDS